MPQQGCEHSHSHSHSHSSHVSHTIKQRSLLLVLPNTMQGTGCEGGGEVCRRCCCEPDGSEARLSLQRSRACLPGTASTRQEPSNCRPPPPAISGPLGPFDMCCMHISGVRPIISPGPEEGDTALSSLCIGLYLLEPLASSACLSRHRRRRILTSGMALCPRSRSSQNTLPSDSSYGF